MSEDAEVKRNRIILDVVIEAMKIDTVRGEDAEDEVVAEDQLRNQCKKQPN